MTARLCAKKVQARPRMQRMSVIASFQKCPRRVSVRLTTHLVGQIGSGVRVSDIFTLYAVRLSCGRMVRFQGQCI